MASSLDFRAYNYDEVKGILQERVEFVFVRNVLSEDCLALIAEKTFEAKDVRKGLFLLKESGEVAEFHNSRKILLKHSEEALTKLADYVPKESQLDSEEKAIVNLIKEHEGKTVKEIFPTYETKTGKSYRTFQRKIKRFREKQSS